MSDLGNYIKEKRIQAGLSYKELSIMTGISDTLSPKNGDWEDRNAKMGRIYVQLQRLWDFILLR